MLRLSILILLIFASTNNSYAQSLVKTYGSWALFSGEYENKKICYIVGEVKTKSGKVKSRTNPYVMVTNFGDGEEEFSVSSGYIYKKESVSITFDKKKKFILNPKAKLAWPFNEADDKQIIAIMSKSKILEVESRNTKNHDSKELYFLDGFSKAYKRMKQRCK